MADPKVGGKQTECPSPQVWEEKSNKAKLETIKKFQSFLKSLDTRPGPSGKIKKGETGPLDDVELPKELQHLNNKMMAKQVKFSLKSNPMKFVDNVAKGSRIG